MLLELALEVVGPALLKAVAGEVAGVLAVRSGKKLVRGVLTPAAQLAPTRSAAGRPLISAVRTVRVVSETPGRLRLEVDGLRNRPDLAQKLGDAVPSLAGVRAAEATPRTGRILIHFDPHHQTAESLRAAVERLRSRHFAAPTRTERHLVAVV